MSRLHKEYGADNDPIHRLQRVIGRSIAIAAVIVTVATILSKLL